MQKIILASVAGVALAVAGCTKQDAHQAGSDVRAAADQVGDKAKEAANSPEVKKLGSEIKVAAKDAAHVTKEAAKGAAEGAKKGANEVETKSGSAADHAKDATDTSKK